MESRAEWRGLKERSIENISQLENERDKIEKLKRMNRGLKTCYITSNSLTHMRLEIEERGKNEANSF